MIRARDHIWMYTHVSPFARADTCARMRASSCMSRLEIAVSSGLGSAAAAVGQTPALKNSPQARAATRARARPTANAAATAARAAVPSAGSSSSHLAVSPEGA